MSTHTHTLTVRDMKIEKRIRRVASFAFFIHFDQFDGHWITDFSIDGDGIGEITYSIKIPFAVVVHLMEWAGFD